MRIIPAIDIIDGKCVRLTQGDFLSKTIYDENPLEIAKRFEAVGIQHLHVVDLDGALAKQIINYKILQKICTQTNLKVDFGGGIRSDADLEIAFKCGANQVTGGSVAINAPELFKSWIKKYGNDKIILGADVKNETLVINGWYDQTETNIFQFIKAYETCSVKYVICTDVAKDGMLIGPSVDLYKKLLLEFPSIKLIASGGVSCANDLQILSDIGMDATIIGKAFYEGRITLKDLEKLAIHNL